MILSEIGRQVGVAPGIGRGGSSGLCLMRGRGIERLTEIGVLTCSDREF